MRFVVLLGVLCAMGSGSSDLSAGALALLHDQTGWEYTSVFDKDGGLQAQHQCFVEGQANADECRGTMTFGESGTFIARVFIHGQEVDRKGSYKLSGNEVSFTDELGTEDGPYSLDINVEAKTMQMRLLRSPVSIGADFLLESEYQKRREAKKKN